MTSDCIDQTSIIRYLTDTFEGVDFVVASEEAGSPEIAWGDTFFFYNPRDIDPDHRFPFATIVTKDYGDFDSYSQLNRPGVFRLNIGLDKNLYQSMFDASSEVATSYDFTTLSHRIPATCRNDLHKETPPLRTLARRTLRAAASGIFLLAVTIALALPTGRTSASIRPARETARAAIWRKLYEQMPAPWKTS